MKKTNIVTIGGGTGSFAVLTGLKKNYDNWNITAIVPSTDSGGSTGRLRDEFGYLPMGDLRQCLVALAEDNEEQYYLRELFKYRFEKGGEGLSGHNFGNLFMTVLQDISGDQIKALDTISKLLNIKGRVLPITLDKCDLVAKYENGKTVVGEHMIDEPKYPHDCNQRIVKLSVTPEVETYNEVKNSIANADYIIINPGDLYTSILANIVINNVSSYISKSKAKMIYISNLFTKFGQTTNYKLSDHVSEIEKYIKKNLDYILVNTSSLPTEIVEKYKQENAVPVLNDINNDKRVIEEDLLATEKIKTVNGDTLIRSLLRHDGDKILKALCGIIT